MTGPEKQTTLLQALLAFQAEVPILTKSAKGEVKGVSKSGKAYDYDFYYADYPAIVEAIQPLLTKCGLVWSCQPGENEQGRPVLHFRLLHVPAYMDSGELGPHSMSAGTMPLILGANPTAQSYGSALTYAKRQALVAVLNLVAEKDDDGKAASKRPTGDARPMPKAEREKMEVAVAKAGKDIAVVLGALGLERLEQVTVGHRKAIKELLGDD